MKYALITGASRGVGKGIALKLAEAGFNLILTCHKNIELLNRVAEETRLLGSNTFCFTGDLSQPEICEELFLFIKRENIQPDIVINNAGVSYVGLLQDMSYTDWNDCINTNLSSVFYTCKLAIPHMLKKHCGKIINISSVWGNIGASCEVAYSAAKGGVNSFTKALAKELAPSNIQVNALALGVIDTEMNSHLSQEDKELLVEEIPAGRMGRADEVGNMILNLLNAPDYLTGQVISMNGGWNL